MLSVSVAADDDCEGSTYAESCVRGNDFNSVTVASTTA